MSEVKLAQMRQHYRAAVVDSEEHAQRLMSLGFGAALAVLLMTAPALPALLQIAWIGVAVGAIGGVAVFRKKIHEHLRETLLEQQLQTHTRLDREIWDRIGQMKDLPQPLQQYVEHFLATYIEFKSHVSDGPEVELGQVQLIQAKDQVLEFIDHAEKAGRIRRTLDTQSHILSDDDQLRLRRMFSDQCAGLQQLAQSFDRSLGNFVVAKVLGNELGESSIEDLAERMREVEEEFEHVKQSLSVDA